MLTGLRENVSSLENEMERSSEKPYQIETAAAFYFHCWPFVTWILEKLLTAVCIWNFYQEYFLGIHLRRGDYQIAYCVIKESF